MPAFPDDYTRGVCEFRDDASRMVFSPAAEWITAPAPADLRLHQLLLDLTTLTPSYGYEHNGEIILI